MRARLFTSSLFGLLAALSLASPAWAQLAYDEKGVRVPLEMVAEATLDIDGDGKMDRAVLIRVGHKNYESELRIYLGVGDAPLDLANKPTISMPALADGAVERLEVRGRNDGKSGGKQSLRVAWGCGGCSNDVEKAITIVHRGGEFLVGGYSLDWDARYGSGHCDINFFTGRGVASKNGGRQHAVKGTFKPVKLAAWNEDMEPQKACNF